MPIGAAIGAVAVGAGTSLYTSSQQSKASKQAANTQAAAADQNVQLQRDIYNQNRADMGPWRQTGSNALAMLSKSLGLEGPQGNADATGAFQASPGYNFAFDQGTRAVNSNLAARGMTRSGVASKELTRFGQGTANQEYGNWLGRLAGVAGVGQTATAQTAQGATAFAQNAGSARQDAANARASGYVGAANAQATGMTNLSNNLSRFAGDIGTTVNWGNTSTSPAYNQNDWIGG